MGSIYSALNMQLHTSSSNHGIKSKRKHYVHSDQDYSVQVVLLQSMNSRNNNEH